jgi:hypothetical protein
MTNAKSRKAAHLFTRRALAKSAGAALIMSPFYRLLGGGDGGARAAGPGRAKRLLLFCTMGTNPDSWSPTGVSGENTFTLSEAMSPLAAIKGDVVLLEGLPSGNPADGHGSPDGLTGLGYGGGPKMLSVEQFVADKLIAAGVTRPIPSLLLGANTNASGGRTMFYRNGNNLPTISSVMSAYGTVFGAAAPASGPSPDAILRRRKSVLDNLRGEIGELNQAVGAEERARLQLHLDSIRQIETRLTQAAAGGTGGGACMKPPALATDPVGDLKANLAHLDTIVGAFACDITRVAAIEFGSDQSFPVDVPEINLKGDQHGGFLHSGAPEFKNLIAFEKWMAQRFVDVVTKLKTIPEADGSGMLFDNTIIAWCRDMGDAVNHNQKSMRFVVAGGAGGYLKRNPAGRYLKFAGGAGDRHERVLLNLCEAMGVTSFAGFGDTALADKTPLSGLIA